LTQQIAANQKGIILVEELIKEYSLATVQAYMCSYSKAFEMTFRRGHIQRTAELAVRDLLKGLALFPLL
jgi:N-methylhydantoinase B/oxoprolinase/acetone carboxylase alpha subunit